MTTAYTVVTLQEKVTKLGEPGYPIMGNKLIPPLSQGYNVCWYFTAVDTFRLQWHYFSLT